MCFCLFVVALRIELRGLVLARQMLYCLSHAPSLKQCSNGKVFVHNPNNYCATLKHHSPLAANKGQGV
jgi:hypothetical protein